MVSSCFLYELALDRDPDADPDPDLEPEPESDPESDPDLDLDRDKFDWAFLDLNMAALHRKSIRPL